MHVSVPNPCFTVYRFGEGEVSSKEKTMVSSNELGLLLLMKTSFQGKGSFQLDGLNQVNKNLQNIGMALAETCFSKE